MHIYGPLWIQSYGLMIILGFLTFLFLAYNDPRRTKIINSDTFFNTIFVGLISAIIGGRILFMISEWESFANPWTDIFCVWQGGFVVLGSIIGVIVTVPIYLKMQNIPVLNFLDIASQYGPLMQSISRIGCLLAGCCYGAQVQNFLFAITFDNPIGFAPIGIPLHATQIYMSILSLIIFILLFLLKPFLQKPGQTLFLYTTFESVSRIGVDFFRGDRGDLINLSCLHTNFLLSLMQLWSAVFLFLSLLAFIFVSIRKRNF